MFITESRDFIREGENLEAEASLPRPDRELCALQVQNLKRVVAVYGEQKVFSEGPEHVAGMVYSDELKPYISVDILNDLALSMHVAEHEGIHVATKSFIRAEPKDITVFEGQLDILDEKLRSMRIDKDQIDLVEGFTEGLAQRRLKDGEKRAYREDVEAAEKLDALCLEKTRNSLFAAFELDKRPLFTLLLRRLGGALLLEEAVDHFAGQDRDVANMRGDIEKRLRTSPPVARSAEEAEKAVTKVIAEILASHQKGRYVGPNEKSSSVSESSTMFS